MHRVRLGWKVPSQPRNPTWAVSTVWLPLPKAHAPLGFESRSRSRPVPSNCGAECPASVISDPVGQCPWPALSFGRLSRVTGSRCATARSRALLRLNSFSLQECVARLSCDCRDLKLVCVLCNGPRRVWTYVKLREGGEAA